MFFCILIHGKKIDNQYCLNMNAIRPVLLNRQFPIIQVKKQYDCKWEIGFSNAKVVNIFNKRFNIHVAQSYSLYSKIK